MFRSRWGTESGGRNLESRICDLLNLAVRGRFALARRFEGWRHEWVSDCAERWKQDPKIRMAH
jgi:hypothetical protein